MEQSLAGLLSGAFSETSLPSFPDGELDFNTVRCDEESEATERNNSCENLDEDDEDDEDDERDGDEDDEDEDEDFKEDNVAEKDNKDSSSTKVSVINMDQTLREQYESSEGDPEEEEGSTSGADEEEEEEEEEEEDLGAGEQPEDWSVVVRCEGGFWDSDKEDRIFAGGLPLVPEDTGNPQVRNKKRGQNESDEDVSYFREIPKRLCEENLQGDGIEEDEQERREERIEVSTHSECEGIKLEKDEGKGMHFLNQCLPQEDGGNPSATLDFPEQLLQNLQDLISDDEDVMGKIKDFSGDDHQEAGESFAQYPSDLSSCEYVEDGGMNAGNKDKLSVLPKENTNLERAGAKDTCVAGDVDTDEKKDPYLVIECKGTDEDAQFMGLHLGSGGKHSRENMGLVKHVLGHAAVTGWVVGEEADETTYLDAEHNACSEGEGQTKATTSLTDKAMPSFHPRQHNVETDFSMRHQSNSDAYCYSDDTSGWRRTDNARHQGPKHKPPECAQIHSESRAELVRRTISDDQAFTNTCNKAQPLPAFSISWDADVSSTRAFLSENPPLGREDIGKEETLAVAVISGDKVAGEIQPLVEPREEIHTTIHSSKQGSVDDQFFFNNDGEDARNTELGQFGGDEYEEERNWEQEQERIKAFYNFYSGDEMENGEEGRKIKVQFCTDQLSQIIQYDADCSERDSLDSSTDGEEELSSTDTHDELKESEMLKMNSSQPSLIPENLAGPSNTQCLGLLKLMLKMCLVLLIGVLMFWWTTDQMDWIGRAAFFKS
ncbi:midasin [Lampris incognitus]|uniref:midasin n=1 Tax=Lampris incognitus TaxID=2546036 RepID=UPI0024B550D8|nr:midasin [Lampris incognitus]